MCVLHTHVHNGVDLFEGLFHLGEQMELGSRIRKTGRHVGEALWSGRGRVRCAFGSLQVVLGLVGQEGRFNADLGFVSDELMSWAINRWGDQEQDGLEGEILGVVFKHVNFTCDRAL